MSALPPGSTIGILGSGQLGRMLAIAAAQLGYRCHIYAPESGPACDVAAVFTKGGWDDQTAMAAFAGAVDVVTFEFENVDPAIVERLAARIPARPGAASLSAARYRPAEKTLVAELGGATARWAHVRSRDDLDAAYARMGGDAILKTNLFGYDGKGQARMAGPDDLDAAWSALGTDDAILEGFVDFAHEFSVLLVRGPDGKTVVYDPPLNRHENGILASSTLPAPAFVAEQFAEASQLARAIADRLDHVGVLAVEFFATSEGPVFNEMAPRVHNSGHWTIEGAETSQFENHIRAAVGLPLGSTALTAPRVEMGNIIGDAVNDWPRLAAEPGLHLHLYGKHEARPGRKMGHWTRVGG